MNSGWYGVDLDGTLAVYDHWRGTNHIGKPVQAMVERVKKMLADNLDVRIFTARVAATGATNDNGTADDAGFADQSRQVIEAWCEKYLGRKLTITATKDFRMIALFDDRCVQIETNTGRRVDGKEGMMP